MEKIPADLCLRITYSQIRESDLAELNAALRTCQSTAASGAVAPYYYENEHSHHVIYRASRNGFSGEEARRLHKRFKPYCRLQLRIRNRLQRSQQEHAEVVAAIEARMP